MHLTHARVFIKFWWIYKTSFSFHFVPMLIHTYTHKTLNQLTRTVSSFYFHFSLCTRRACVLHMRILLLFIMKLSVFVCGYMRDETLYEWMDISEQRTHPEELSDVCCGKARCFLCYLIIYKAQLSVTYAEPCRTGFVSNIISIEHIGIWIDVCTFLDFIFVYFAQICAVWFGVMNGDKIIKKANNLLFLYYLFGP